MVQNWHHYRRQSSPLVNSIALEFLFGRPVTQGKHSAKRLMYSSVRKRASLVYITEHRPAQSIKDLLVKRQRFSVCLKLPFCRSKNSIEFFRQCAHTLCNKEHIYFAPYIKYLTNEYLTACSLR